MLHMVKHVGGISQRKTVARDLRPRTLRQTRQAHADPRRFRAGQQDAAGHFQGMARHHVQPQEPAGIRAGARRPACRPADRRCGVMTMDISQFKPAIVYTIYIASTPEKVWQALTLAEFSRKYFFGNAVDVDLRVGGAYIVRTSDGSLHISGEVIECDPPRKLTVTFNVNWPELVEKLGPTLVTYEIEQAGEAVRLTLSQSQDRELSDDILSG